MPSLKSVPRDTRVHGTIVTILHQPNSLGCKQRLRCAVNDRLGIEPDAA
jgi:hypothetical protein